MNEKEEAIKELVEACQMSLNRWDVFNLAESVDFSNSEYYEDKINELEILLDKKEE